VNGLDPEGVAWIRGLLRSLAAEGRTVFVSSHLMSEMENTAGHLVVIGQGRLIADTGLAEFTRRASADWVQVRCPRQEVLARLLRGLGARAEADADGSLTVHGVNAADVGELAAVHGIALHELVTRRASLEEAFMELTRDAADYQPHRSSSGRAAYA
jgi:ABC-2 type transport system ATP-binding protein